MAQLAQHITSQDSLHGVTFGDTYFEDIVLPLHVHVQLVLVKFLKRSDLYSVWHRGLAPIQKYDALY